MESMQNVSGRWGPFQCADRCQEVVLFIKRCTYSGFGLINFFLLLLLKLAIFAIVGYQYLI